MSLELINARRSVAILEAKLHAAKEVVAFLNGTDAPSQKPEVKPEVKPEAKPAGTAGKKARAEALAKKKELETQQAKLQAELDAKKSAAAKEVEAAAKEAAAPDEQRPDLTFKEGKINVFGDGLVEMRHLTAEERAPYTMGVTFKNMKRDEVLEHGVIGAELVQQCWDNMSETIPNGMTTEQQDAIRATPAWATMPVPKELMNHMMTRVEQPVFQSHVVKLMKVPGAK